MVEFSFLYPLVFIAILFILEIGDITDISVSCRRSICDITDTISVWTEDLGFKRLLCEDEVYF